MLIGAGIVTLFALSSLRLSLLPSFCIDISGSESAFTALASKETWRMPTEDRISSTRARAKAPQGYGDRKVADAARTRAA